MQAVRETVTSEVSKALRQHGRSNEQDWETSSMESNEKMFLAGQFANDSDSDYEPSKREVKNARKKFRRYRR